jgi:hypothetical protein
MTDADVEQLQEAGADIAWLTSQGYSPTAAIAKVASAARFPVPKTRLLTYAYANGVAAEKRASSGGPFERLAGFTLPDPEEIHRLVYGEPVKEAETIPDSFGFDETLWDRPVKPAAPSAHFPPHGMATFDHDLSRMEPQEIRDLFGLPVKTAGEPETDGEGHPVGQGVTVTRTTISIGLGLGNGDGESEPVPELPASFQEKLSSLVKRMSPQRADELETTLLHLLGIKKNAMIAANAEADDAFHAAARSLDRLGNKVRHRHLSTESKRAGLLSVNAFQPDIAAMLVPYLCEVDARLVKDASHDSLQVTRHHPWVAEADTLYEELENVARLTVEANRKTAAYQAVWQLWRHRANIKKSADWSSFLAGSLTPGIGAGAKELLMGSDSSRAKSDARREVADSLYDEWHDLLLRDIETKSMVNEFGASDPILGSYDRKKMLDGYNDLIRTAPDTMRNPALARALLRQSMSQGNMALTEYVPALQINKLDPRKHIREQGEKKET